LVNPTSCSDCDPWAKVDEVRLDVLVDNVMVVSETFVIPEEDIVLPDLTEFGVVRVVMVGLSAGEVVSAGRTYLIPTGPGAKVTPTMAFLPVNQVLPLTTSMVAPRSHHASMILHDGRALLVGGVSPGRDRAYAGIEIYDPRTGGFASTTYNLASAVFSPRLLSAEKGEVLFIGGGDIVGGNVVASSDSTSLFDVDALATPIAAMSEGRLGHCISSLGARQAVVFGGHAGDPGVEYLKRNDEGVWSFTHIPLYDFDDRNTSGCATLADGQTFLQGIDAASTGIWTFTEETAPYVEPTRAFVPIDALNAGTGAAFVSGASLLLTGDDNVWIGGGAPVDTGLVAREARSFNPVSMKFERSTAQPERSRVDGVLQPWIEPGWQVWGCGFSDGSRANPEPTVELFNVETGELGVVAGMDRVRSGCDVRPLPDGSVLVSGGFSLGDDSAVSAGIFVPWRQGE
jgi:hypothetical protein